MKQFLFTSLLFTLSLFAKTQTVDSIYINLYTDSLKKGTHNYINVDGKLANGKWKPMTAKEIDFFSTYGKFEGNELFIPLDCKEEKVTVKVLLKTNPSIRKEITIWIKKKPDDERLPTKDEIMKRTKPKSKN